MTIQNLPAFFDMVYTKENGQLSVDGYLYNDQMFQALNLAIFILNNIVSTDIKGSNITLNGLNPPSFTTAEITTLFLDPTVAVGTIWYDKTLDKLTFKGASAIQTITSI